MAAGFRAVVFDFDFTLADASAGIIPAVNGALQDIGHPQMDEDSVRAIIGLSLPEVLRELTGITSPPDLIEKFASRFIARADSLEDNSGDALSTVLPGVADALELLHAAGLKMAIASTKGHDRIAELIQAHGLSGKFDAIVGAEDVPEGGLKPAPDALHQAAARLGLNEDEILYCGDHTVDALAAARAGIGGFIGVLTGATTEAQLREAMARGVAENGWAPRVLEVMPGAASVPYVLGLRQAPPPRL